ncbi:transposase [Rhodoblastus sphagnicola]|nr:transposase [Rhodoblastus sphagnicola]
MSIRFWSRRFRQATSSLWTISAAISGRAIKAAGAQLPYLPPYSPDFNPIENAFSKLKALLRKAAERTVDGLWAKVADLLAEFSPKECANFFAAAGYKPV